MRRLFAGHSRTEKSIYLFFGPTADVLVASLTLLCFWVGTFATRIFYSLYSWQGDCTVRIHF